MLRLKIEHHSLNSHPFRTTFSGIDFVRKLAEVSIFFNFILQNFIITRFEREGLNT